MKPVTVLIGDWAADRPVSLDSDRGSDDALARQRGGIRRAKRDRTYKSSLLPVIARCATLAARPMNLSLIHI